MSTKTQYAHAQFEPWRFERYLYQRPMMSATDTPRSDIEERCILAEQSEWELIRDLDGCYDPKRPPAPNESIGRVEITTDIFREWNELFIRNPNYKGDGYCRNVCYGDLIRDVFKLIDSCPNLTFLASTEWPERAYQLLHDYGKDVRDDRYDNLYLGTRCSTQDELDRRWKELAECRDLSPCLYLDLTPTEAIDTFRQSVPGPLLWGWVLIREPKLNAKQWIQNDWRDWVESIVSQCQAASIPVWDDTGVTGVQELPEQTPHA